MFDDGRGTRLVILSRNMKVDREAAMTGYDVGNVRSIAWARNGLGFSLIGPLDTAILHSIADRVSKQLSAGV